jgi:hypothetical protein
VAVVDRVVPKEKPVSFHRDRIADDAERRRAA